MMARTETAIMGCGLKSVSAIGSRDPPIGVDGEAHLAWFQPVAFFFEQGTGSGAGRRIFERLVGQLEPFLKLLSVYWLPVLPSTGLALRAAAARVMAVRMRGNNTIY